MIMKSIINPFEKSIGQVGPGPGPGENFKEEKHSVWKNNHKKLSGKDIQST